MNSNWNDSPETLNSGPNQQFFGLCYLEIWWMTSKNNRAPLLCHFKLCALFHSHLWFKTWVTISKRSIRVIIINFLACVTLKCDLKKIGHLFYTTSSFVHCFVVICEFKTVPKCTQIGTKFVLTSMTLTFDIWPWLLHGHHLLSMVITVVI